MNESTAREEICRVGRSLFERGYVHASAGNISVRLDDGILITPTDACLGFLDPAALSKLDAQGRQISGAKASKTIAAHAAIYAACAGFQSDIRCIIHTHSTHLVALSLQAPLHTGPTGQAELLAPITPYFVMKVGHVPLLAYQRPGAPQTVEAVAQTIANYQRASLELRAVMLQRLGPKVWCQSPAAAMAVMEELEETAKLWMLSSAKPSALNANELAELRQVFNAAW
jgi:3-dehydro-4-phosphotetronate decarboxylase